jgi:hypothetical protein
VELGFCSLSDQLPDNEGGLEGRFKKTAHSGQTK